MLKPLSNRVVLQFEKEEEKKVGSFLLPNSAKPAENMAKVVAVAKDVEDVKVGDMVVFEAFASEKVAHNGEEYIVVKVENLVAIVD
ncbi:co-chaperone GroES [Granulicatella sp. zg-ZJ]|uniref:GroES family chaperonin n=1 Tax=unclassified Granulicatella TaxID=2630493 RepID=UPI0013C18C8B|nr:MULTISPECIES: co-chaperone GroES [unclassified Granulicatella]MBS4749828.1 co-chaperone GroES [Carnobacteriaceae bacterium zg-ZUI78]NEW63014.1 co-chaperone GroES [Granulicatella sp. zg-ZJ]NEW66231.1 co-chaperone GroES [Granulicatella sp. zg-84]QMI85928.1 co-chaperone GroES [Carnobacteriaceae bacterium zg-84]